MSTRSKNRFQHKTSTNRRRAKKAAAQRESRHRVTTTASLQSGEDRIRPAHLLNSLGQQDLRA